MCDDHIPTALDSSGDPLSKEFADLGLEKAGPAYHCDDCMHVVKGRLIGLLVAGVALSVAGVMLMIASLGLGAVVFLTGAGLATYAYLVDRKRLADAIRTRPPLPVIPNVDSVKVREKLHGKLTLDRDGTYDSSVTPVNGEVTVSMTLGRLDWDRLTQYRKKFRLTSAEPVEFCAGFAVLRGTAGLEFLGESGRKTVIPLTGKVDDHPFFNPADSRTAAQWSMHLKHELRITPEIDSIPIWLTPSLVPEQDQRSLELELQWINFGPDDAKIKIDRFEPLRIAVPVSWGNVESASREPTVGREADPADPNEMVRVIEWTHLQVTREDEAGKRIRLAVRFENRIELNDTIRGSFTVSFNGALSGLTGIDLYHPLGGKRLEETDLTVKTKVAADFELSLLGIRFQDLRLVPDRKKEKDHDKQEAVEFHGVVPDHETVIDLTNMLSDEDYYVKRVIENPPRSGSRANVVNRYWDIAGRRYDGVYPMDFHMILTGEEVYQEDSRAHGGSTTVRITVQGAYASPGLEAKIEQEWERLRSRTVETLTRRARVAPAPPGPHEEQPAEAAQSMGHATEDAARRASLLRRRLDDATDAVINGRIDSETYQVIKAATEQELRNL